MNEAASAVHHRTISICGVTVKEVVYTLILRQEDSARYYVQIISQGGSGRVRPDPDVTTDEQALRWHLDLIMLYYAARTRPTNEPRLGGLQDRQR